MFSPHETIAERAGDTTAMRQVAIYDEIKRVSAEISNAVGNEQATIIISKIKASPHSFLPMSSGVCTVPTLQVRIAELYLALQNTSRASNADTAVPVGEAAQIYRKDYYARQVRFMMQRIYLSFNALSNRAGRLIELTDKAYKIMKNEFKDFEDFLSTYGITRADSSYFEFYDGPGRGRGGGSSRFGETAKQRLHGNFYEHRLNQDSVALMLPGAYAECQAEAMRELLACLVVFDRQILQCLMPSNSSFRFPPELQQFCET